MCKQNGWSYEIFEEIASSKTIEQRKELLRLLERVMENSFDAVVVMDTARLSRDDYGAAKIKRDLFLTGTYIVTPTKIYDPYKDEDSLLLGIQALVASQEYKQILKRMQRGKHFASKQGQWTNGIPPLGYSKNPKTKKLEPNNQANHVKFIYNSIINGKTVSEAYQELNMMGVKTRTGGKFHFNSILRIVNNEAYKGTIINNRIIGKHGEVKRPKDQWIIVENAHDPIIDEETWKKANKIVNTYSFSRKRSDVKTYPTSKLIYCGNCGKVQGVQMTKLNKLYLKICQGCYNRSYLYEPILKHIKEHVATYRQDVLALISDVETTGNSTIRNIKRNS